MSTKKIIEKGFQPSVQSIKYQTFFENAPIALWIEDFSKAKRFIDKLATKNSTTVPQYIINHPEIIPQLTSMVVVKDVNETALSMYNAKNKEELFKNLSIVFTEKSNIGFSKLIEQMFLGDSEAEIETVNKTLDGQEFDIAIKFKVVEGYEETLENVIVTVENITDRIKAREELAESEQRYKESQALAKIGSWVYDFEQKKLHWSEEAYKMLDLKPNEYKLSLDLYLSFVHPEDKHLVEDFSIENLLENKQQFLNYRIITKEGVLKYIYERRSVEVKNDRITKIIGIGQDISESVLIEEKLNATRNLLSNTLSSINDGLVILNYDSKYIYINDKAEELLGKKREVLLGKNIWNEFPEKEGDLFYDMFYEVIKSKKPCGFENYFKPWKKWFENRMIPSSEGVLIFFQEITEKKKFENRIKTAYNIINKSSSVAVLCKNDWDFPVEFASENATDLFGYSYKDLLQNKVQFQEVVFEQDLEYIRSEIFKLKRDDTPDSFISEPFRIITKKGEVKWIEAKIDAIRDDKNKITHIQGITSDVSERKKVQELLFKNTQHLIDQFNNTPLASIIWDLDFCVKDWNNSAERIFGYSKSEALGKHAKDLIIPEKIADEIQEIWKVILTQEGGHTNTNENITAEGNYITCDWYNVTLKDSNGNITGVASLVEDITEKNEAKNALEKSEKKYRDLFEKSQDAIMIVKDGVYEDCNEATLKLYGCNHKNELIGKVPYYYAPEYQPDGRKSSEIADEVAKITLEKGSHKFTFYRRNKQGVEFPSEIVLTRIVDYDNSVKIHGVVKDISERLKKEKLESVLYNISNAALRITDFKEFGQFIKDELHRIIDTNNFYIALYNEEKDTITTPFIVDEFDYEVNDASAKNTLTGYVIKSQKPLKVNIEQHNELIEKGEVKMIGPVSKVWIGAPLKSKNKVFGALVVQNYLSDKVYSESDVQLLEFVANQISSAIQIKNYQNELEQTLVKAQESDRLKSAFLANMSHEIRTPMNGIIGFSELLADPNLSTSERESYANIVINSSKQLLSIVNDILDISKIEAGVIKLNYEPVNVNHLIDELFAFYKPKAVENNLKIKCEKSLENDKSIINIDKTKLNQVLTNLLSNAFKFTESGSVSFGYELFDDFLQFYVKDTGVGIDENIQNKIFDRFIQANLELNKQHSGTGLGLAISKKFVELFKGKIWLSSSKNGTTVCFTVPYNSVETKDISSPKEVNAENKIERKEVRILVAEDEEYNMLYINELFSKTDYILLEASNGKEAVDLVNRNPEIDVIFMDIKMPIMNGKEAMRIIKERSPKIPIIALTAFAMESDVENSMKQEFDDYLTKPIDKKQLFKLIEKYTN